MKIFTKPWPLFTCTYTVKGDREESIEDEAHSDY